MPGQPVAVCVPVEPHQLQASCEQSPPQTPVSGLPDEIEPGFEGAKEVGSLVFGSVKRYETHEAFTADEHLHRVPAGSRFGWIPGCTECLCGWEIVQSTWHEPCPVSVRLRRFHRSIFRSV
ncbi:hypothetical protein DUNSADRAFT_15974 [Dunaliella salina]|uniref:Uncharacterized protein n=1 Tax=Dunaliella salina TaxID=3046 RepID=A0ABQ7G4G7_DUNSA|nr:hypothetical protein DUNSADRAFT_15974 [Dunaliella salina]|eukprot:KAF5829505.1 hypothetical protein DUNSADRAFT_15974 [Dunaliella salina]